MPKLPPAQLPLIPDLDEVLDPQDLEAEIEAPKLGTEEVNEDGSVTIFEEEPEDQLLFEDFDENLAMVLPKDYLRTFGTELQELIEKDTQDREGRDKQY